MFKKTLFLNHKDHGNFLLRTLICLILLSFVFLFFVGTYVDASVLEKNETVSSYVVDTIPNTSYNLASSVNWGATDYFPPIGSQQGGSCVAWAIAYYQFTFQVAEEEKINAKVLNNIYSPKYVWNYLNNGDDNGIYVEDCYEFIKQNGCIKWSEFPQSWLSFDWYSNNDNEKMLNTLHSALNYKIDKYHQRKFIENQGNVPLITANNSAYLYNMKKHLSQNKKVLCVSMMMEGAEIDTLPTSNLYQGNPYVVKYTKAHATSHFITIVGYNDNIYYDLNGDGQRQDFEYGAFLAADSRGSNFPNRNNGYIWIMYDALNKVSNATNLNTGNRVQAILNNKYWYIDVKKCEPKLTVEVTVSQKERNEFKISLFRKDEISKTGTVVDTFVNAIGGDRGFDGVTTNLQSYTFVFDYEAHGLYDGDGYHYGVKIEDLNVGEGKNTVVQKIVWKDENGTVIEEITPNDTLGLTANTKSKDYYTTLEKISIQQDDVRIRKGSTLTPNVVVEPSDLTFNYTLESSNTSRITVNNDQITAVGKGIVDITATAVLANGKELTATCRFSVYECFGDTRGNATPVEIDSEMQGFLYKENDVSWLKFTAEEPDDYIFYVYSVNTNPYTVAEFYIGASSTPSIEKNANNNGIIAAKISLAKNQTCYIKIYNQNDDLDNYNIRVNKSIVEFGLSDYNPDERCVHITAEVSSMYDVLNLTVGELTLSFQKSPSYSATPIKRRVVIDNSASVFYTTWDVYIDVSTINTSVDPETKSADSEMELSVLFEGQNLGGSSETVETTFLAYKTLLKGNVYGDKLSEVIQSLGGNSPDNEYRFVAYTASEVEITATGTTSAATGMKIVKIHKSTDKIVAVYHLVVVGDAQGDGEINNLDSTYILKYDAGLGDLTAIQEVAADANGDSYVDNLDSTIILKIDAGLEDVTAIDQELREIEVPVGVYFGEKVDFSEPDEE